VRVIIVDDTRLYRSTLADALAAEPSIEAVASAADADAALALLDDSPAGAVMLLNMSMADGMAVLHTIHDAVPGTPVIALAVPEAEDEIIAYAEAGVAGCLLKSNSFADLLASITIVAQGGTWCPPRVAAALLRRVATLYKEQRNEPADCRLTTREREVVQLIEEGLSNKQIARRLSIELRTVKNHVHHILVKYKVHHRADAAALFRATRQNIEAPFVTDTRKTR
jgi:two-component system, NarL family, nitrate/nitrite response regulator NarL